MGISGHKVNGMRKTPASHTRAHPLHHWFPLALSNYLHIYPGSRAPISQTLVLVLDLVDNVPQGSQIRLRSHQQSHLQWLRDVCSKVFVQT